MKANPLVLEQASPFNVPMTVELLLKAAADNNWQNPATHNLQESLAKSGQEVRPVQVIEICKPEYSGKMLEKSDERIASIMMPCRISVYEKEDGKTYVALINAAMLAEGMPDTISVPMNAAADETLQIVKSVIGPF